MEKGIALQILRSLSEGQRPSAHQAAEPRTLFPTGAIDISLLAERNQKKSSVNAPGLSSHSPALFFRSYQYQPAYCAAKRLPPLDTSGDPSDAEIRISLREASRALFARVSWSDRSRRCDDSIRKTALASSASRRVRGADKGRSRAGRLRDRSQRW